MTRVDLTATTCRKAKKLLQLSSMVVNVLAEACFSLPGFAFASLASMVMMISLSLDSSALLVVSYSFAHSVMELAKILRSLPVSNLTCRIAASI